MHDTQIACTDAISTDRHKTVNLEGMAVTFNSVQSSSQVMLKHMERAFIKATNSSQLGHLASVFRDVMSWESLFSIQAKLIQCARF